MLRRGRTHWSVVAGFSALVALCPAGAGQPDGATHRDLVFDGPANDRTYEARLVLPPEPERNGYAVLLLGGGSVTDMHWTVPAEFDFDGRHYEPTIDHQTTRDADTIAAALADAGFVVMQWSSIHRDDELAQENPALAMGIPYPASVALARRALTVMRGQPEVDPDRVILLGHSLGATRACQIADDGVVGMVFLAGAYLSRFSHRASTPAAETFEELRGIDADADGIVNPKELHAFAREHRDDAHRPLRAGASRLDRDGDGVLRNWEITAARALERLDEGDDSVLSEREQFRDGLPWADSVLRSRPHLPVLSLHGGLDALSVHGPLLERLKAEHGLNELTIEYFPGLGHQLSRQEGEKIGPIDPGVVARIVEWMTGHFATDGD